MMSFVIYIATLEVDQMVTIATTLIKGESFTSPISTKRAQDDDQHWHRKRAF